MKKFLQSLLLVALLSMPSCASPIEAAHKASLHIAQQTVLTADQCSAVAIGPHAIMTASHCELPSDTLYIQNVDGANDNDIKIVDRIRDDNDHTIYLLKNVQFDTYVSVDLKDKLEQGEDVFMFGNPGEWADQLRKGYITGVLQDESLAAMFGGGSPDEVLLDIKAWHGDSGAAIYNSKGDVILVLTGSEFQSRPDDQKDSIRLTFGFKLAFKADDLARAISFSVPNDPKPVKHEKK